MVAIVGQTNRSAMGGSYQQEVDLLSLFKDVASEYVQMVTVPEQLPNVLDRAIRIALAERAPTAIIIPSDVQELEYSAPDPRVQDGAVQPRHRVAHRRRPTTPPSPAPPRCSTPAARSRSWSARAPAAPAEELAEVAELLGAGVAKALLGKDVLSDELPLRHRLDRAAGHPAQLRDDEGLRHAADRRVELPLHPVHAGLRPGPRRADRHRREVHRHALPLRGQPGRRRRRDAAGAHPAAGAQDRTGPGARRSRRTSRAGGR